MYQGSANIPFILALTFLNKKAQGENATFLHSSLGLVYQPKNATINIANCLFAIKPLLIAKLFFFIKPYL